MILYIFRFLEKNQDLNGCSKSLTSDHFLFKPMFYNDLL